MKELTIEQKAQRYDEALKEAVIAHKDEDRHLKATLERIFPELAESEDEKIRNEIISALKFANHKGVYDKHIAWLEKQESYYTFEIKEGHWYKCVCDYMLNGSDLMFKNDRLYYCRSNWRLIGEIDERNVKDIGVNGYKSFFRPATNQEIKDWLEKKVEQKPTDEEMKEALRTEYEKGRADTIAEMQKEWSEEDELSLKQAIYVCHQNGYTAVENWLKSLKDRVQQQSMQEWSEEDKEFINDLIGIFDGQQYQAHSDEEIVKWLKSIRLPYNKEWDENDEEMLKSIIATCELACEDRDSSPARHLLQMQTDWLKSLKQRLGG